MPPPRLKPPVIASELRQGDSPPQRWDRATAQGTIPPVAILAAKAAIARRAKPSALPDHVKLVPSLDLRRDMAERLSAKAIREGKNLDAVLIEILALNGK
jgi:hypothetical protein